MHGAAGRVTPLVVETTNFTDRTHFGYNNRYNSEVHG